MVTSATSELVAPVGLGRPASQSLVAATQPSRRSMEWSLGWAVTRHRTSEILAGRLVGRVFAQRCSPTPTGGRVPPYRVGHRGRRRN